MLSQQKHDHEVAYKLLSQINAIGQKKCINPKEHLGELVKLKQSKLEKQPFLQKPFSQTNFKMYKAYESEFKIDLPLKFKKELNELPKDVTYKFELKNLDDPKQYKAAMQALSRNGYKNHKNLQYLPQPQLRLGVQQVKENKEDQRPMTINELRRLRKLEQDAQMEDSQRSTQDIFKIGKQLLSIDSDRPQTTLTLKTRNSMNIFMDTPQGSQTKRVGSHQGGRIIMGPAKVIQGGLQIQPYVYASKQCQTSASTKTLSTKKFNLYKNKHFKHELARAFSEQRKEMQRMYQEQLENDDDFDQKLLQEKQDFTQFVL